MKTTSYNPSHLEVALANAFVTLRDQIEPLLDGCKITGMENNIDKDNPLIRINIQDSDGDPHSLVLKIIQKPDSF
ncbi:MAG: hypothetical protein HC842_03100 [Cytophagales bacterium]|nr:hypothetical protein [Cytophagales bacterium]